MTALLIFVFIECKPDDSKVEFKCLTGKCKTKHTSYPFSSQTFDIAVAQNLESPSRDQVFSSCLLPPYPEHGNYTVSGYPSAKPGESYASVLIDVSCDIGYQNTNNTTSVFCVNGYWSATIPTCGRFCQLEENLSVEYRCAMSGPDSLKGSQECDSLVPLGTVVTPICRSPGYFSRKPLDPMHCIDGLWNYNPICTEACGMITQHRQLEGTSANHVELPWHAIIYGKASDKYQMLCGGSLISSNTVISVAHCFWKDQRKLLPASNYAVAVGKLYGPYKDLRDINSQQSDVADIRISPRFQGAAANYQDDIAIVIVETPFYFLLSVRPVCLDFDYQLDKTQLAEGNSGKAVGWNIGGKAEQSSRVLTVVDLPYLKYEDCIAITPTHFRKYITSDKFCAGSNYGPSFCAGDSGGGVAILEPSTQRHYLRGVLSIGHVNEDGCTTVNVYTSILKHEHFIKQFL